MSLYFQISNGKKSLITKSNIYSPKTHDIVKEIIKNGIIGILIFLKSFFAKAPYSIEADRALRILIQNITKKSLKFICRPIPLSTKISPRPNDFFIRNERRRRNSIIIPITIMLWILRLNRKKKANEIIKKICVKLLGIDLSK